MDRQMTHLVRLVDFTLPHVFVVPRLLQLAYARLASPILSKGGNPQL